MNEQHSPLPKCGDPDFLGDRCLGENCKYAFVPYQNCPYFDKNYKGDSDE